MIFPTCSICGRVTSDTIPNMCLHDEPVVKIKILSLVGEKIIFILTYSNINSIFPCQGRH